MPCASCSRSLLRVFLDDLLPQESRAHSRLPRRRLQTNTALRRLHTSAHLQLRQSSPDHTAAAPRVSSISHDDVYIPLAKPASGGAPSAGAQKSAWPAALPNTGQPTRQPRDALSEFEPDIELQYSSHDPLKAPRTLSRRLEGNAKDVLLPGSRLEPVQGAILELTPENIDALAANGSSEKKAQRQEPTARHTRSTTPTNARLKSPTSPSPSAMTKREREPWQVQKAALISKLGPSTAWLPRKRLSPDALDGIRALHAQYPTRYTTPVLAAQFKVSPDAIRRILKGKWRPSEDVVEERRERWLKRGEGIWERLAAVGVSPPKKWRDMGVKRAAVPIVSRRWSGAVEHGKDEPLESIADRIF